MSHTIGLYVILGASTVPASAQFRYGTDVTWHTRYEWRGLTVRDGMVLQPDVYVSHGDGRFSVTAGAWTTVEMTSPNVNEFGYARTLLGESNIWAELAANLGNIDLAAGWNWYRFNARRADRVPVGVFNTHELYGRVQLLNLPIVVPRVDYFHDIDKANGGFIEASLMLRVPLWTQVKAPIGSILLTGATGYNISQDSVAGIERFRDAGFKYATITASTVTGYLPVSLFNVVHAQFAATVGFHLQFNLDQTTQTHMAGLQRLRDTWLTIGLQWSGPRCEPTRQVC